MSHTVGDVALKAGRETADSLMHKEIKKNPTH